MLANGDQLKKLIQNFYDKDRLGSVGRVGEAIFASVFVGAGHIVETLHGDGVDFVVDEVELWDVKTRGKLGYRFGSAFNLEKIKKTDVNYAYVIFFCDFVGLILERVGKPSVLLKKMTWEDACEAARFDCLSLPKSNCLELQKSNIKNIKLELRKWIAANWGLNARIIHRSGRAYQDSMERGGWGADSFYTKNEPISCRDVVVLIFFDGGQVYKLYAYRAQDRNNIQWKPKPLKTGTLKPVFSFDPRLLASKFIFSNISQFKKQFLART